MGVTAIKRVFNERPRTTVLIENLENIDKSGNRVTVGDSSVPAGDADADMWIPWCTSADDFRKQRFIRVSVFGPRPRSGSAPLLSTFRLWQAAHADGDFIRITDGNRYEDPGTRISGESRVDGDRTLVITSSGLEMRGYRRRR